MDVTGLKQRIEAEGQQVQESITRLQHRLFQLQGQFQLLTEIEGGATLTDSLLPSLPETPTIPDAETPPIGA